MEETTCKQDTNYTISSNNICRECKSGYYFDLGSCSECGSNCLECLNTSKKCITCPRGYYLNSSNGCESYESKETCEIFSNEGQCIKCYKSYFKINNTCYSCSSECSTCRNNMTCLTCKIGYTMIFTGEYISNNPIKKCKNNNTNGDCIECKDGYYLMNKECINCSDKCFTCLDNSTCTIC